MSKIETSAIKSLRALYRKVDAEATKRHGSRVTKAFSYGKGRGLFIWALEEVTNHYKVQSEQDREIYAKVRANLYKRHRISPDEVYEVRGVLLKECDLIMQDIVDVLGKEKGRQSMRNALTEANPFKGCSCNYGSAI